MRNKMRNSWLRALSLTALALLLALAVAACGGQKNEGASGATPAATDSSPESSAAPSAESGATVYPLTVKDDTGAELTFERAPEKVVTLVPSETEIIFAIGAGDQVAGVDENSNYPAEAADKPKVGDMNTNIEAVAGLNPDLVLASASMNAEAVEKLRSLGIAVYASDPTTYDAVVEKIKVVGEIMNRQAQAAEVAKHMVQVKREVTEKVKSAEPVPTYLEFSEGWTVGKGEFLDELLTLAGGANVAGDQTGWFEVDAEAVVKANPAVIVYPDIAGVDPNPIAAAIASRPGWDVIDAVKNNRVIEVSQDPLVRVGPRLADGLLELAKAIHPDLFQ
ncbi:ABC transporter substrate-binding protein [Paenibacillus thailandensis]|uniref:ABC transporter substrate-binding protein n=1 Tax=Paenibacillus thailandensis TaxID=393250 RepID=A0ABW5R0W1_9BACL